MLDLKMPGRSVQEMLAMLTEMPEAFTRNTSQKYQPEVST